MRTWLSKVSPSGIVDKLTTKPKRLRLARLTLISKFYK